MRATHLPSHVCTPKWRFVFMFLLLKTGVSSLSRTLRLNFTHQYKKVSLTWETRCEKSNLPVRHILFLLTGTNDFSQGWYEKITLSARALIQWLFLDTEFRVPSLTCDRHTAQGCLEIWVYCVSSCLTTSYLLQKYRGGKLKIFSIYPGILCVSNHLFFKTSLWDENFISLFYRQGDRGSNKRWSYLPKGTWLLHRGRART